MSHFTILVINCVCLVLLSIMTIILLCAAKLRSSGGLAAVIIFVGTVPAHFFNLFRSMELYDAAVFMIPIVSTNALLMPLLWIYVHQQLSVSFKFKPLYLLHFLPCLVSSLCLSIEMFSLDESARAAFLSKQNSGYESTSAILNDIIVFGQVLIYFPLILVFMHRVKKRLLNTFYNVDLHHFNWIHSVVILLFALFMAVFIAYIVDPRTDVWLIPVLNTILTTYILYMCIAYPMPEYRIQYDALNIIDNENADKRYSTSRLTEHDMQLNCEKIEIYLKTTNAYKNPDFSVSLLSEATRIPSSAISQSLNQYLKRNFFDMINRMRVEDVKARIQDGNLRNYTVESLSKEAGFRSRASFYATFKKMEGLTPLQWIKEKGIEVK